MCIKTEKWLPKFTLHQLYIISLAMRQILIFKSKILNDLPGPAQKPMAGMGFESKFLKSVLFLLDQCFLAWSVQLEQKN